jgi:hypothetical protein
MDFVWGNARSVCSWAGEAAGAGSRRGYRAHQIFPRSGHPGSDGANRATTHLGGSGVIETQNLSKHKGVTAVGF